MLLTGFRRKSSGCERFSIFDFRVVFVLLANNIIVVGVPIINVDSNGELFKHPVQNKHDEVVCYCSHNHATDGSTDLCSD